MREEPGCLIRKRTKTMELINAGLVAMDRFNSSSGRIVGMSSTKRPMAFLSARKSNRKAMRPRPAGGFEYSLS